MYERTGNFVQGDMLNSIEKHVEKSKDWVGVATAEIKRARIADRRYRKVRQTFQNLHDNKI